MICNTNNHDKQSNGSYYGQALKGVHDNHIMDGREKDEDFSHWVDDYIGDDDTAAQRVNHVDKLAITETNVKCFKESNNGVRGSYRGDSILICNNNNHDKHSNGSYYGQASTAVHDEDSNNEDGECFAQSIHDKVKDDTAAEPVDYVDTLTSQKVSHFIELWDLHQVDQKAAIRAVRKLLPPDVSSLSSVTHVAKFFLFVHERQCCWKKRNQGERIFSNNPIFQQFFFCNNYRELDRGTCYFRSQMLSHWEQQRKQQQQESLPFHAARWLETVLFASYVYRQVNKIETFIAFGGIPTMQEWSKFQKWAKQSNLKPFFTGAHQTNDKKRYFKYVKTVLARDGEMFQRTTRALLQAAQANNIVACFETIYKLPGCGPFFAWQITCDLLECHCLGRCTENQWTKLGPGADLAMKVIFPRATDVQYLELAQRLTEMQTPVFKALGVDNDFARFQEKDLTLKNIEHALCEYQKFLKVEERLRTGCNSTGGRKRVSRTGMDLESSCFHCPRFDDSIMICDTCLNAYCPDCDKSTSLTNLWWICQRCVTFDSFFQENHVGGGDDNDNRPLIYLKRSRENRSKQQQRISKSNQAKRRKTHHSSTNKF